MENLKNLEKIAKIFQPQNIITSEEIDQVLKGIMEILASYKKGTDAINEDTKAVVNSLLEQTIKYNQETISDFKSEAEKAHAERMKELQSFLSDVKTTLGDMEVMMSEVKDGKDADEERVIDEVINRIKIDPTVVTMSAEEVRDKLASLKEEDRLDKSAIKGLEKVLQQKDLDYAVATLQHQASFLINKGGLKVVSHDASLSGDGTPEDPLKVESTSGLTLETDGTPNGDQTLLNLVAGTNMTITDDGNGNITFDATGGSGSGDVTGPASSTDNAIARFDGITGKIIQNSAATIADSTGNITAGTYNGNTIGAGSTSGTNTGDQTITLTGDITGGGTGSFATTLATVNSNVGSFTNASITVNGKGLVTAASNGTAPVTSVTGTADRITITGTTTPTVDIAATYAGQTSITTLGTVATGTWGGTTVAVDKGGTGQTTYTNGQLLIGNTTGNTLTKATLTGTSNQVVVTNGGGSITLSTPQDIATTSTPQFASVKAGYIADTNGNEEVIFTTTASAVNEITVANAATGNNPNITASGSDSNIGLDLTSKGTGSVNIKGNSTQAGQLRIYEDTDDGSNYTAFKVGTQSGNVTYTLPTGDGSSGQFLSTNGSGGLSWATGGGGGSFVGCRIYKSAGQSIGTTLTAVTFDTESFDTDTMHDNVTNNTRITFTTAGYYEVNAQISTSSNAVARFNVKLNGSTNIYNIGMGNTGASLDGGASGSFVYQFSASDYIEMFGYFATTVNTTSGTAGTQMSVVKVG